MSKSLGYLGDCVVAWPPSNISKPSDVSLVEFQLEALLKPCIASLWKRWWIKCHWGWNFPLFLKEQSQVTASWLWGDLVTCKLFLSFTGYRLCKNHWVTIHCWPRTDAQKSPSRLNWLPKLGPLATPPFEHSQWAGRGRFKLLG